MYGLPNTDGPDDYYYKNTLRKRKDLAIGFCTAIAVWALLFRLSWYVGPVIIAATCFTAFIKKYQRRYVMYGALSLIFAPVLIWGSGVIFQKGLAE